MSIGAVRFVRGGGPFRPIHIEEAALFRYARSAASSRSCSCLRRRLRKRERERERSAPPWEREIMTTNEQIPF